MEEETVKIETSEEEPVNSLEDSNEAGEEPKTPVEESPLTIHAISLRDNNILPSLNIDELKGLEEESRFDYLNSSIEKKIQEEVDGFIKDSTKEFQEFVKARDLGLSVTEYTKLKTGTLKYENLSEDKLNDNVDYQKSVLQESLKEKGYSDEDIVDILERKEEKGTLEEESKKALKHLKELSRERENKTLEEKRIEKEKAEKYENTQREQINEIINNTEEIITGIKIDSNERKELKKILTVPVRYDKSGNPIGRITEVFSENQHLNQLRLAYYIMKGLFSKEKVNDKIFSKSEKEIKKNVGKEIADAIKKSQREQGVKEGGPTVRVNKKEITSQDLANAIPVNIEYSRK